MRVVPLLLFGADVDEVRGAALRLGEHRAATKLKMPDCCVLYTAEHHGAGIATFDDKLATRAGEIGIAVVDSNDL